MGVLLKLLRVWVGLVGGIALVNAVQCFWDTEFLARRIYTLDPQQVTPLFSRMFAAWTLLAGVVRVAFCLSAPNHALYLVTLFSFLLAFAHFFLETVVIGTAGVNVGTISPFIISSLSVLWMLAVWPQVTSPVKKRQD